MNRSGKHGQVSYQNKNIQQNNVSKLRNSHVHIVPMLLGQ